MLHANWRTTRKRILSAARSRTRRMPRGSVTRMGWRMMTWTRLALSRYAWPATSACWPVPRSQPSPRATMLGSWEIDHARWVMTLRSPEEQTFYGRTLEEGLAWCLVWLMAPEIGIGPFRV